MRKGRNQYGKTLCPTCVAVSSSTYLSVLIMGGISGFPSIRINLSPFTKDFRGREQLNEYVNKFFVALPSGGAIQQRQNHLSRVPVIYKTSNAYSQVVVYGTCYFTSKARILSTTSIFQFAILSAERLTQVNINFKRMNHSVNIAELLPLPTPR